MKKRIKSSEIKHLHVPMYEDLTLDHFLKYAEDFPFVTMCLPDRPNETKKLGRQYIINVLYTRLGDKFKDWVDEKVNARHEKVKKEGNKYIELEPELAKVFYESKAVSTNNGNVYHLFKANAKRRRTKKEIEEDKLEEARKKMEIDDMMRRFKAMEEELAD